jgi:1,4-dihydroxy-2-naphthoyl-CoA hydrolase
MTDDLTAFFHKTIPFAEELGMRVLNSTREEVRAQLPWTKSRTTTGGSMHGGVLMALADTTGAVCAFLNLPEDASGTTTIESKTNFLRALRTGHATAVSRPLHAGRRIMV